MKRKWEKGTIMVNFDIEFQISSTNWRLRKNWNFFLHPRGIVSFFFF